MSHQECDGIEYSVVTLDLGTEKKIFDRRDPIKFNTILLKSANRRPVISHEVLHLPTIYLFPSVGI